MTTRPLSSRLYWYSPKGIFHLVPPSGPRVRGGGGPPGTVRLEGFLTRSIAWTSHSFPLSPTLLPPLSHPGAKKQAPERSGASGTRRKPGSVFRGHLSGTGVATGLKRPIPQVLSGRASPPCLPGLAPGGVCRAPACCQARRWALTPPFHPCPHRGKPRPLAVSSLWHFPSGYPAQALPGTLPYGARTFLTRGVRPSGATAPSSRATLF